MENIKHEMKNIHSLFQKPNIQIVVEYVHIRFLKIALVLRKLRSCFHKRTC